MIRSRLIFPLAILALSVGLLAAGCELNSGVNTPNPNPSPSASTSAIPAADLEACEHLNDGEGTPVTAALAPIDGPDVSEGHRRYAIALQPQGERYTGYVLYNSKEEAHYVLFFDQDVPLTITDANEAVVPIESSASSSVACGSVKARYEVHLEVGPYALKLGPAAASTVNLVIEESAHGHDDDHDHAH